MKKMATLLALTSMMALGACGSVNPGEVGIWNRYGALDKDTVGPGLQWYNPAFTSLEHVSIQSVPFKGETPGYTKDLQTANIAFNIVTSLQQGSAVRMFQNYGQDWRDKLVPPTVEATIKDVFGQFEANTAIGKRPVMQAQMLDALRKKFGPNGINVESFQITNIHYSEAFNDSVEKAQVATQNAVAAQNHTVEVTENAKQTVISANAEAERIKVQANAISSNPAIVKLRAVEKWDGVLPPMYANAPLPFIGDPAGK